MAGPYTARLLDNANGFNYNGANYSSGDTYQTNDACEMKGFYAAFAAANPDLGIQETTPGVVNEVDQACPTINVDATPPPGAPAVPNETNPASDGGDSANRQGAPTPATGNQVSNTPNAGDAGADGSIPPAPTQEPTRPPEGQPHPTHGGDQPQVQTNAGDPVDIFTGAFYLQEKDLEIPHTILPLSVIRVYRSGAPAYGPFGWNWDHNYNLFLRELSDGNIVLWRNLHEDLFTFDGANFDPPPGVFEKLEQVPGLAQTYEIKGEGGTVMRYECPPGWTDGERIPLIRVEDRHGNTLNFAYGDEDKLVEVRDDDDRYFHFEYDLCGLLVKLTDHNGRAYLYGHDEQTMQLTTVTSPPTTDQPNGVTKVYHYEEPSALPELRHNILRVEDSEGNIYLENSYEEDPSSWNYARITEQLYGGYLYQYQYTPLQWVPENTLYMNIPALRVEVMNPDYGLETYTFNYRGDLLDRRFRLNKDQSFRVVAIQYEFDQQGNLATTTRSDGSQEINTYNFNDPDPRMRGKLLQRELTAASGFPSPSRIIWKGKYEPVYQLLAEEKNEIDATTTYKYDFEITPGALTNTGKLVQIVHPDCTLPDGSIQSGITHFENNNKSQVTAIILPDGTRQEMSYGIAGNAKSRLIKQAFDTAGLNISNLIDYNGFGFDSDTTDGNGNTTKKIINALGLLEKHILPVSNGESAEYVMHYNADRKLISSERPKGNFTDALLSGDRISDKFDRDVIGHPVKYTLSSNTSEQRVVNVCFDYRGYPLQAAYPDGSCVEKIFDERGLSISEKIKGADGSELVTKKVYDRNGNLVRETDVNGSTTTYEYDGFARISKITLPNSTEITYTWQKGDLVSSLEIKGDDGFGNFRLLSKYKYAYDEKYRKIAETILSFSEDLTTAVDLTTKFFYTRLDKIEKIIDNRGGIKTFQYDGLGRLTMETDAMGNEEHYFYDGNGNLTQTDSHHLEPNGTISIITKKMTYDERNRKTAVIEPDGAVLSFGYDNSDLLVRQTDYLGLIKEIHYNSFANRLSEIYDPAGLSVAHRWTLDNMSRVTEYTDPTGQQSTYVFDGIGRITKLTYPNGFSSIRTYNNFGQLVQEELGSGVAFQYGYDNANRLINITNSAAPAAIDLLPQHQFTYDGMDRLVSAEKGMNNVVRKYDSQGRLISETTLGDMMSCQYDDILGTIDKKWPDGRTEKYSRNLNGIITKIEETIHGTLGSGGNAIVEFLPSGASWFGQASCQGNLTLEGKYDERKRLVELAMGSPGISDEKVKYRYDMGNRKRVEAISSGNPVNSYFDFDNKYRLKLIRDHFPAVVSDVLTQAGQNAAVNAVQTASAAALHEENFTYDGADARMQHSETGNPIRNYTYLPGHRVQNDGVNNYTHFADGTVQDNGEFTFKTDALGRIVAISAGPVILCSVEYDALGRPSTIQEAGKPLRSFNYLGVFAEQENDNGVPMRQKTVNPFTGFPIAYHCDAGKTYYTLFDGRFNLSGLFDTNGNLLETYRYKAFGIPGIYDAAAAPVLASLYGIEPVFGGQRYLSSIGLFLSKRRLMDPAHGFFLLPDPKGYANSASLYVYAAQNPIDLVDPDGEFAFLAIVAVIAVGALVAGALDAGRQGIQIWEGSREHFSWGELGMSMGIGAVAAPVLVVAPELAVPLAAYGVYSGINQMRQGHYATGTYDIVTALAPFGFKNVRSATFGRGSAIGQVRGLGPMAPLSVRTGRFPLIENNLRNFLPSPFGRRIGLGFARLPNSQEGHTAVILENPNGGFSFFEKNAQRNYTDLFPDSRLLADFGEPRQGLLEFYEDPRNGPRPFEYYSLRVPRSSVDTALQYAQGRTGSPLPEPFDLRCANCSHFSADVLGNAGFNGLGTGRASGLYNNFLNFGTATNMTYAAPFWTRLFTNPTPAKK